jgi:hypothetical protein
VLKHEMGSICKVLSFRLFIPVASHPLLAETKVTG